MTHNLVAVCVVVALIVMASIGFAQKRHECWNGHVLKNWRHARSLITREPCGSVSIEPLRQIFSTPTTGSSSIPEPKLSFTFTSIVRIKNNSALSQRCEVTLLVRMPQLAQL